MTTLSLDCITTESRLHALAGEWRSLWRALPDKSPFQSPDWQLSWWRQFGTGRPVIGVLRDADRMIGLLPAYVLDEPAGRKLLPIGAGLSDMLDALIAPGAPADAATRLLAAVLRAAPDVDVCDMIDLPPDARLRDAASPEGWISSLHRGEPCPVLPLPAADIDVRGLVSAATSRLLRLNRNRAKRAGGATFELAGSGNLQDVLRQLFAMHEARWTARAEPGGVLADRRVGATLAEAAAGLHREGVLLLPVLRIGADVAAAYLAFRTGSRLLLYMSGFSAAHAFCSPASVLLGEVINTAMRDGVREVNFLRGNEPYKYSWGGVDRHNATLHLVRG